MGGLGLNKQIKEWVFIGLAFGLGFNFADQLIWYFFDILKMSIGHPLG